MSDLIFFLKPPYILILKHNLLAVTCCHKGWFTYGVLAGLESKGEGGGEGE